MRFSVTLLSFTALTAALPTKRSLKSRQAAGPVLADTTYDAISISGGEAGNAEQEALDVFSALDLNNPENIDPADIEFLGAVNNVANDAETEAFNTAIEAASGEEATALENGKIKNKVLKLMATKIELEAQQAQGEDVAAKLEEELTKLNNNIALDQEAAGQASTALPFDATISGGGGAAAGAGADAANNNVVVEDAEQAGAAGNAEDAQAEDAQAEDAEAEDAEAEDAEAEDAEDENAQANGDGEDAADTEDTASEEEEDDE